MSDPNPDLIYDDVWEPDWLTGGGSVGRYDPLPDEWKLFGNDEEDD